MAEEYVNKESLAKHIERSFGEISTPFVVREIKGFPTADVAPKSEVEALKEMFDATIAGQETLQKALAEANSEVERLITLNSQLEAKVFEARKANSLNTTGCLVGAEAVKKLYKIDSYNHTHDEDIKREVAREIFEAVDSMLELVCAMTGLGMTYFGKYSELKKKYTEGKG